MRVGRSAAVTRTGPGASQWADTTAIALGERPAPQRRNIDVTPSSSTASIGEPWARKAAGSRVIRYFNAHAGQAIRNRQLMRPCREQAGFAHASHSLLHGFPHVAHDHGFFRNALRKIRSSRGLI